MSKSAGPHAAPVNARGERPVDVPFYYKVDANPRVAGAPSGIPGIHAGFAHTIRPTAIERVAGGGTIATIGGAAAPFCHIEA